mmetsp:Transcript_28798/g.75558  ORF Transcript_28798/g.75558 Transcript_28798/m.75558 type:complete len:172 (-) Transcript_28798:124-639(-)
MSKSSTLWAKRGPQHLVDAAVATANTPDAREKVEAYGHHCHACRQLDYLAIQCGGCGKWFCQEDGLPHLDACEAAKHAGGSAGPAAPSTAASAKARKKKRCKAAGCRKAVGLVSHTCSGCSLVFCTKHRFQTDHGCGAHRQSRASAQTCAAAAALARADATNSARTVLVQS